MKTTIRLALVFAAFWAGAAVAADATAGSETLEKQFLSPPGSARPWVYWFWLNSNLTREVITADLEAMQRVGIGGVLILDVIQGAPPSPMAFGGPQWRAMFQHVCREAARLGLEVNMYNCAGFTSSGGPWITPELSMQKLVWTEASLAGPRRVELPLAQPEKVAGYYRDIAVVAFPTPAGQARIEDLKGKTLLERHDFPASPAAYRTLPAEQTIPGEKIVELTAHFKDGRLTWDVPPGRWTVLRFGHTSTGAVNLPPPESGRGLECDKLSAAAADAMFAGLMAKLVDDNRPLVGKSPRRHAHRQLGGQLAELDGAALRRIPEAPQVRPPPLLAGAGRARGGQPRSLRAFSLGLPPDDRRVVSGDLSRAVPRSWRGSTD